MREKNLSRLPAVARAELVRCVEENLTAGQARLRLIRCGVPMACRTVSRRLAEIRAEQQHNALERQAEQRRIAELEALGRGLGSVQIGATGAAEILPAYTPEWRERQAATLRDLFEWFLQQPRAAVFTGLVVGLHALLLSHTLADHLGANHA